MTDRQLFAILWMQVPRIPMTEIAQYVGISVSTGWGWKKELGLPNRPVASRVEVDRQKAEELMRREPPLKRVEMAAELGIGLATLAKRLNQWGLRRTSQRKKARKPALYRCPLCGGPSPTPVHTVCKERQRGSSNGGV